MSRRVEIEAIYRKEIDVDACVRALLAFARQLQAEAKAKTAAEAKAAAEAGATEPDDD